jgi:Tol biopolymer transport system component
LYSLRLSRDAIASGEPERLTFYNRQITSPVWTKDGRELLFVRHEVAGTPSFWRVQIGGKRRIEALPIPVDSSFTLTLSPRGDKIVYTRDSETVNIWAVELDGQHHVRAIRRQIASTWAEGNPQFSPDGRRIAYQSLQSGRLEIWACDRDGSHTRQLTQLKAAVSGFARWSPDGKKIVFHSRPKSLASLYLIDADGGKPQRITGESGNDISPSWSHDGKWIYFASTRAGQEYIWRMPATGGAATKISEQSGWCPLESIDGQFLFYMSSSGSTLRSLPLSGGSERELLSGVSGRGTSYAPANHGIYFIRTVDHDRNRELAFFDFASQSISVLARIEKPVWLGLAVSPEEDLLLYSQVDHRVSNLMLVEDFH